MRRDEERRAATVIAVQTARRAIRSGALWGAIFGLYVYASAAGYAATYPSLAARRRLATSLGANAGLATLLGPARRLDTVAGFTAWRTMGVLTLVGAIWGLLLATRMLRGEEDAGRWELFLSGQTTRRRAWPERLRSTARSDRRPYRRWPDGPHVAEWSGPTA